MSIPLAINSDYESLKINYPGLTNLSKESYGFSVTGNLDLIDSEGKFWDSYTIKLAIPNSYPKITPDVFEISDKIPKIADRHVNSDGSLCLSPLVEQLLILGDDYDLSDYIKKLVIPFLAQQTLFDLGIKWENGEYSHGEPGLIEYYKAKFKANNIGVMLNCLRNLTSKQRNRPNSKCFCRSRLRYIECHRPLVHQFNNVSPHIIAHDLKIIENYLKRKL